MHPLTSEAVSSARVTDAIEGWLGETPELLRVLAVNQERRLPRGRRLVITALELWTTEVRWHVAEFPPPDMAEHESTTWPMWTVTDDVGTTYEHSHSGGSGSDRWWRASAAVTPTAPAVATRLTIRDMRIPDDPVEIALG